MPRTTSIPRRAPAIPITPRIDPSQWETVEDTAPAPDSQKLSYDGLAKVLEEMAQEYDKDADDPREAVGAVHCACLGIGAPATAK
jgi:hypothetical protein